MKKDYGERITNNLVSPLSERKPSAKVCEYGNELSSSIIIGKYFD
jgi:hypothetical protein